MFSLSLLSRFLKDREIVFCIVNGLQARRCGDLISAGAAYISPKLETVSGAHTASYSICTVPPCLGIKRPDHVDQPIPVLPRPRLSGAKPLLSTYTFSACAGTSFLLSRFLICVNGVRTTLCRSGERVGGYFNSFVCPFPDGCFGNKTSNRLKFMRYLRLFGGWTNWKKPRKFWDAPRRTTILPQKKQKSHASFGLFYFLWTITNLRILKNRKSSYRRV